MTNPSDIRSLADSRLEEAELLSKHGFHDCAFYIAGYALELQLKAKICEHFDLPDFYSQYVPRTDLAKTFLIHNLERLILLSGLNAKFEAEKVASTDFDNYWYTVMQWSEKSRYNLIGTQTLKEVTDFLDSIKIIIEWIKIQ